MRYIKELHLDILRRPSIEDEVSVIHSIIFEDWLETLLSQVELFENLKNKITPFIESTVCSKLMFLDINCINNDSFVHYMETYVEIALENFISGEINKILDDYGSVTTINTPGNYYIFETKNRQPLYISKMIKQDYMYNNLYIERKPGEKRENRI